VNLTALEKRVEPFFRGRIFKFSFLGRVPEASLKDNAGSPNNLGPRCPKLTAVDVTAQAFCERLVLVPGLRGVAYFFTVPSASTLLLLTLQLLTDFSVFFSKSGSNLVNLWYPLSQ